MGKTARGKLPPDGFGDADGRPTILPAEKYGATRNSENPELYVAYPYRLYGVGKPDLQLARLTKPGGFQWIELGAGWHAGRDPGPDQ